ncbi:MAG TPA: LexA family transcriptional regulator [Hyphomicrobiales bacterium]|nr:LexA family transcriptional regulator [Hyphomicrobiales bacterium]
MRDWTAEEIQSIAARLRRARLSAGFGRATEAVRKFGWNYSRYMNYENGERAIPPKQAILFAAAYGVSVDFIYFGEGDDNLNQIERRKGISSRMVRRVPLVALGNIAELQRIASGFEPMLAVSVPVSAEESLPENAIFIEIEDKSMSNANETVSFEPGDKAMIEVGATPSPSDFVLALVPGERMALFRLYREIGKGEDGSIVAELVPLNPNFRTIRIADANSGQIIGVCRRLHRIFDLSPASRRGPGR